MQREDGAIPWFRGHHLDPWDHTEAAMALDSAGEHEAAARAYTWLARHQNEDGSWFAAYADGAFDDVTDRGRETNFVAYIAVGVWHHYLSTGDDTFLDGMWPTVYAAVEYVLRLQQPGGQIGWRREDDGTPTADALLTGSSSIHQALRCALAIAEQREEPQPDWELAVGALRHAIRRHPERFLDKDRYSMDWYYPVLGGALTGTEAKSRIEADWERFVVPGLGVRCVVPNPWVTGASPPNSPSRCGRWASPTGRWRSFSRSSICGRRSRGCTGPASSSRTRPSGPGSSPLGRRGRWCWLSPRSAGMRRRVPCSAGSSFLPGSRWTAAPEGAAAQWRWTRLAMAWPTKRYTTAARP